MPKTKKKSNAEEEPQIHVLEMNQWHENMETGQKDVRGKRVEIRGTGEQIANYYNKHKKIIRKGQALTRRLQSIQKRKMKDAIGQVAEKVIDELIADARRGIGE